MKRPRSLKSRALQLLAQRDQSRVELRRKLLAHASALAADAASTASTACAAVDIAPAERMPPDISGEDPEAQVDAVLAWLEANRFLCAERFAESRVHAREARFGNLRIRQELARHQVELSADTEHALVDSELGRARTVRARKFPDPPDSAVARARQARFLAARGFSADVIRRVLREAGRPAPDDA